MILAIVVAACGPSLPPTASLPPPSGSAAVSPAPTALPTAGGDLAPRSVAFWDERHGVVVGSPPGENALDGLVATTADGGRTWRTGPALGTPLVRVTIGGSSDAWATADCEAPCRPPLLHSGDGGLTWQALGSDGADVSVASFANAVHGWGASTGGIGDDGARLFETQDGGVSWKPRGLICGLAWPELAGLRFVDDRHGWIVCSGEGSGTMGPSATFETLDGGASWRLRSSVSLGEPAIRVGRPPTGPVVGAFFLPSGHGWVWQGRSGTETTRDGGATWDQTPPGEPEDVFVDPMWFVNDRVGFALVFADGASQLWTTEDGGRTWRAVHRW